MATKKDREMAEKTFEYESKISEIEHQHRQELKERDKEVDEWKEKCFQLMIKKNRN